MLTQERVKELLTYDPETGEFRWKEGRRQMKAGSVAGSDHTVHSGKKYRVISIDGKKYQAHRLAWLVMHGEFPPEQIDHIDGNGLNNRFENLRAVSNAGNGKNVRKRADNTSGVSGVHWHKTRQKWQAHIRVNQKLIHLGRFTSQDAAVAARKAAEIKYGFHANHGTERPL